MTQSRINIIQVRNILVMWFILFALSPCTVKEVLFDSVNFEYTKPINKSRTTAPINTCLHAQQETQQTKVANQADSHKQVEPIDFRLNGSFSSSSKVSQESYSKKFSGNSPPKYILYKRLKLDVA